MSDGRAEVAWIDAARRGDRTAFAQLVQAHQGFLRQFLRRLCKGDAARADDLAQEAFLSAWRGLPGFRGEARFRSWLCRLAINALLQQRRRGDLPPPPELDAEDEPVDADFAPRAAARMDLARALERLREPERQALLLCCQAELSHAEAAALLGWPLGTVKTLVLRARAKLRVWLADWDPEAA